MGVFDSTKKVVLRDYLETEVLAADVDSANKIIDGVIFSNFHSMKLGSTDGIAYGTTSNIFIPISSAGYRDAWIQIRTGATFMDQAITLGLYESRLNSFNTAHIGGRLLQIILAASTDTYFGIGSGVVGQGGVAGVGTPAIFSHYAVSVSKATPWIVVRLSGTAPTTGEMQKFNVTRGT